eukprot:6247211-Amphidinium_carterae.1
MWAGNLEVVKHADVRCVAHRQEVDIGKGQPEPYPLIFNEIDAYVTCSSRRPSTYMWPGIVACGGSCVFMSCRHMLLHTYP